MKFWRDNKIANEFEMPLSNRGREQMARPVRLAP